MKEIVIWAIWFHMEGGGGGGGGGGGHTERADWCDGSDKK